MIREIATSAVAVFVGRVVVGEMNHMATVLAWERAAENHARAEGTWCPHETRRAAIGRRIEA